MKILFILFFPLFLFSCYNYENKDIKGDITSEVNPSTEEYATDINDIFVPDN